MAPAATARRTVSSAARAARACGQFSTATERDGAIVRPACASLVAQAGPAWAILIASRARVAWVTVTVTKPGPVTSAVAIHSCSRSRTARPSAAVLGSGPSRNGRLVV